MGGTGIVELGSSLIYVEGYQGFMAVDGVCCGTAQRADFSGGNRGRNPKLSRVGNQGGRVADCSSM